MRPTSGLDLEGGLGDQLEVEHSNTWRPQTRARLSLVGPCMEPGGRSCKSGMPAR